MKNIYQLLLVWHAGNGGGGATYSGRLDISDDNCANWRDVTLAYKRADLDGVVRSFSTSFEFVKDAADVVTRLYNIWCGLSEGYGRGENDFCRVELRLLQEDWTYTDDPQYMCDLDFLTFKAQRGSVSVSAIDSTLAALIKKQGGTKYTFTPFKVQDAVSNVVYQGLPLTQRYYLDIDVPTGKVEDYHVTDKAFGLSFNGDNSDKFVTARSYGGRVITFKDFAGNTVNVYADNGYSGVRKISPAWVRWVSDNNTLSPRKVTFSAVSNVTLRMVFTWSYTSSANAMVYLYKVAVGGTRTLIAGSSGTPISVDGNRRVVTYEIKASGLTFAANDTLLIEYGGSTPSDLGFISDNYDAMLYLSAPAGTRTMTNIPAMTPAVLASVLSYEITGRTDAIRIDASSAPFINNLYLFSGGWFNVGNAQNDTAEFNVSYNDFRDFLSVLYDMIPVVTETGDVGTSYITFKVRGEVFPQQPQVTIPSDLVSGATLTTAAAMTYARFVIGYDAHTYDNIPEAASGGFAVPVTYEPHNSPDTDRELKITTPWRGDSYAFEELVDNYDATATQCGDIYFLNCIEYTVPEYDDNTKNNPYFPLQAGKTYLIPQRDSVELSSSDVNDVRPPYYVNADFAPMFIASRQWWRVLPSIGTPTAAILQYISQEGGDTRLSVEGRLPLTSDVDLTTRYAKSPRPVEFRFTTTPAILNDLKDNPQMCIDVQNNGKIYRGWVLDAKFHILHRQSVEITMLINSVV